MQRTSDTSRIDPVKSLQANWAQALYSNMVRAGGLLRTKAQTYAVLTDMVASLGDRYSAFLPPSLYRLAIRHPNPSEVRYLAAQYTGIGIEVRIPLATVSNLWPKSLDGFLLICRRGPRKVRLKGIGKPF